MIIDTEDIKQAVVERLLDIYPDITVYKEAKTNVIYPHFFVYQITLAGNKERKNHHILSYSMEIRYRVANDPSTDLKLEQNLDAMGFNLIQKFDIIDFEQSKIKCKDRHYEKVDGVLHFFFNVDIMVKDVSDEETIKQNKLGLEVEING